MKISADGEQIILLLRDSVLVCSVNDLSNKWKVKFDPIDE